MRLLIFLLCCPLFAFAQLSRQDSSFFQQQILPISLWLDSTGIKTNEIKPIIAFRNDTLFVSLLLRIDSGKEWKFARDLYAQKTGGNSLERDILDKWCFLCDIPPHSARLYVQNSAKNLLNAGIEAQKFKIEYLNAQLKIDPNETFLHEGTRATVAYNFSLPVASNITEENGLSTYKAKIKRFVDMFYANKGTYYRCGNKGAQASLKLELDNSLEFIIHNLSGEVFYDFSSRPFELIFLKFEIDFAHRKAKFRCNVDAKYCPTMSCYQPRNNAYKPSDFSYQSYVQEYAQKITNELNQYLNKR